MRSEILSTRRGVLAQDGDGARHDVDLESVAAEDIEVPEMFHGVAAPRAVGLCAPTMMRGMDGCADRDFVLVSFRDTQEVHWSHRHKSNRMVDLV